MLSSLPTELLRLVIESTVPRTFRDLEYPFRQARLRRLCLVSRRIRDIAQPLLYEIACIGPDQFDVFRPIRVGGDQRVDPRKYVRWLVLYHTGDPADHSDTVVWDKFDENSDGLPRGVNPFASLLGLVQFYSGRCCAVPVPLAILAKLTSLTLVAVEGSKLSILPLLSRRNLPKLQTFTLVEHGARSIIALAGSEFATLLPQLVALSFTSRHWIRPEAAFLHVAADRTLVDYESVDLDVLFEPRHRLVHVRLPWNFFAAEYDCIIVHGLDSLTALIKNARPLILQSLYLDGTLRSTSTTKPSLRGAFDRLVVVCRERKVDLVFEMVPSVPNCDPIDASLFFWRQLERRKLSQVDK